MGKGRRGGGKVHAPKEPLEQRTPKQHSADQKHHSTTHMLNFYLYGRVNARRDGQSEICIARKREKKIKNLEIRKANFEVFVFTLSLTGAAETRNPPRDFPDAQP